MSDKRKTVRILSCLLLVLAAAPAGATEVTGSGTASYQFRYAPGKAGFPTDRDQDLDFWGRADAMSLLGGKAEGHLTFRAFKDVDGTLPGDKLQQIGDTFGNRDDIRVYEGFLTLRHPARPLALSVGRQYVPVGPGFAHSFDGARGDVKFLGGAVRVGLFGGAIVSHFHDPDRDGIFGGKVAVTPWSGGSIELSDVKYTNHLWEIAVTQRVLADQAVSARFASIDGDPHLFRLDGHFHLPAGIGATAHYSRKIGSGADRNDFPFDFTSPDDAVTARLRLGNLAPYARYSLNVTKRLGTSVTLGVGGARRKLVHDEDENEFNRSDWEIEASADAHDLFAKGLSAYARYRRIWEDRKRATDGSSGVLSAGVGYALTPRVSAGVEVFANAVARTVPESIIPEGFAVIDRKERGGAVWAKGGYGRIAGEVRYEVTDDDLYGFYGAKAIHSAAFTLSASL